mgnify:CR=1 FL=1
MDSRGYPTIRYQDWLIHTGRPAAMLRLHEVLAWVGSLLILVHAETR